MHKDVELSEQGGNGGSAAVVMLEAVVHTLQDAHAPAIVLLPRAIRQPDAVKPQNPVLVDGAEIGLLDQIARNDLVVRCLGIVIQAVFADDRRNLMPIQAVHALHGANIVLVNRHVRRAPIVDVKQQRTTAIQA